VADYILHALHGRLNARGEAFLLWGVKNESAFPYIGGSKLSRRKQPWHATVNYKSYYSNINRVNEQLGMKIAERNGEVCWDNSHLWFSNWINSGSAGTCAH